MFACLHRKAARDWAGGAFAALTSAGAVMTWGLDAVGALDVSK